MIAVAFAGHGAEHPGMGAELVEPDAPLVALAAARGGFDAGRLLRRGGPQLHRTATVQPLLTAVNLTILAQLREAGLRWQLCLGPSLGELAAWAAAGGLSFRRLLDQVRFAEACALLGTVEQPLHELAEALGYSEGAHFSRAFRRWTGVPPSAYLA